MTRTPPPKYHITISIIVLSLFIFNQQGLCTENFSSWLDELRQEARAKGISELTIHEALDNLEPIPRVIELDRRQPEFVQTDTIEMRYGVQPRFLVAFWGLETNFGDYLGSFSVIGSLATLAHDPRRSDFFRSELLAALSIIDGGHISAANMLGSWAGAMGQPQFMPSTFVRFAVDGDGDGRRDIWYQSQDGREIKHGAVRSRFPLISTWTCQDGK
jgi:membrane-bound lytic murein transglycosylase B